MPNASALERLRKVANEVGNMIDNTQGKINLFGK